jgi:hypothetical protein
MPKRCKTVQDRLTTNQRKALRALLSHRTVKSAADACGLAERTMYHYLSQDHFRRALRDEQDRLTSATVAALTGGAGRALDTLARVMDDPDATAAARVRAAVSWLRAWRDALELDDLAQRVAALESLLGVRT